MTSPPPTPPPPHPDDSGAWHALGPAKQFTEGRGRICQVGAHKLAVFRKDGALYAIDNRCPHAAASLGLGAFKGLLVACPRHHWQFNVATGACLTNPTFCVKTFPCRVRAGQAEVCLT
jgi:nitrite reductase/ring-hydroxylating ferredoxin subunit